MNQNTIKFVVLLLVGISGSSESLAQEIQPENRSALPPVMVSGSLAGITDFYDDEIVKDAPVSARVTTRSEQRLYDGNRIVQEDVVLLHRDSEGRVRRVQTLPNGKKRVTLSDPKLGKTYVLDASAKQAVQMPSISDILGSAPFFAGTGEEVTVPFGEVSGGFVQGTTTSSAPPLNGTLAIPPGNVTLSPIMAFGNSGRREVRSLGQDQRGGVRVEGTVHTTKIEANTIGNEKAIVVEKTTWFAPELRMMVRSEESDPRFGTITYTADVLSTDEPDAAMFEIPDNYSIVTPFGLPNSN